MGLGLYSPASLRHRSRTRQNPSRHLRDGSLTAPLAPRFSYLLEQGANREYLTTALKALQKLTDGDVYLGVETPLGLGVEGV